MSAQSACPECWICDDVIIRHPVTDFNGHNNELTFHTDWFCCLLWLS